MLNPFTYDRSQVHPEKNPSLHIGGTEVIRTMKLDTARLTTKKVESPVEQSIVPAKPRSNIERGLYIGIGVALIVAITIAAALFISPQGKKIPKKPNVNVVVEPPSKEPAPPLLLFAVETSKVITVSNQDRTRFISLVEDLMKEPEREGTIKRLAVKIQEGTKERFMHVADLFNLYLVPSPERLIEQLEGDPMLFIYYGKEGPRIGFAVETRDENRALREFISREPQLLSDFRPIFHLEKPETEGGSFEDRTYRNIDWRYLKLSPEKDLGIAYGAFPAKNLFILTTSKVAIETVIDRLFGSE